MEAKKWKTRIKKAMTAAGTYQVVDKVILFDSVISSLADILEERDRIRQQYIDTGAQPLVVMVSDRGAENMKPNPLLKQWSELNNQALAYWRDLGLTPAGLRKINEEAMNEKSMSPLEAVLNVLEN